jgi:transposase
MRAYSVDLRRKIVEAVWRRMSKAEAARAFGVAISSVKRYVNIARARVWCRRRPPARIARSIKNTTLLASMTAEGMGPCVAVEGTTTSAVFEAYVEQVLVPTLRPGQVVVLDNLSSHKGGRVRELVESRGCELLFLPLYSPDLNPIEEAFSKVKGLLRRTGARTREALIEAMGQALDAVTSRDARGFFEHCGYHSTAQPLCQLL